MSEYSLKGRRKKKKLSKIRWKVAAAAHDKIRYKQTHLKKREQKETPPYFCWFAAKLANTCKNANFIYFRSSPVDNLLSITTNYSTSTLLFDNNRGWLIVVCVCRLAVIVFVARYIYCCLHFCYFFVVAHFLTTFGRF